MPVVKDLREGLAVNLRTIDGLNVLRSPHGNITTPCAYVVRDKTAWDYTMQRGTDVWTFLIQVLVGLSDATASQDLLDEYVNPDGDLSVKAAIEADPTLGGYAEDLIVTETGRDEVLQRKDATSTAEYLGAQFTVDVYASGSS